MKKEYVEKFVPYKQGKSIKGTETEKNLLKSFAGESQARQRYLMFADIAREEGYEQIAAIFEETALNEKTHAETFFSFLEGEMVEIQASYPAGKIGNTYENLLQAAEGEHEEFSKLYPEFAEIAAQEGFPRIANAFKLIAKVEEKHEERFRKLAQNIQESKVFAKDEPVVWICRECGYIHVGPKAPAVCPCCLRPQSYFEIKAENY